MNFPDVVALQVKVRRATKEDLLVAPKMLKQGQPYFIYSLIYERFEGIYFIDSKISSEDMKIWFDNGQVYVPVNILDNDIVVINQKEEAHVN